MSVEPTVDVLLSRFRQELQSVLYPFLVLSIVERNGPASHEEIREEIFRLTGWTIASEAASHTRLIGRLRKTFRLIEPIGKHTDAALVRYRLTTKGKRLYSESLSQVIYPLANILPTD